MSLSLIERETIINFNAIQEDASIFTAQPEVWRRLEKIDGFKLIRTERLDGQICAKEFYCPKSFVRLGGKGFRIGPAKKVSEAQRERAKHLFKSNLRRKPSDKLATLSTSKAERVS